MGLDFYALSVVLRHWGALPFIYNIVSFVKVTGSHSWQFLFLWSGVR